MCRENEKKKIRTAFYKTWKPREMAIESKALAQWETYFSESARSFTATYFLKRSSGFICPQ